MAEPRSACGRKAKVPQMTLLRLLNRLSAAVIAPFVLLQMRFDRYVYDRERGTDAVDDRSRP